MFCIFCKIHNKQWVEVAFLDMYFPVFSATTTPKYWQNGGSFH
jgi:hypothetical protein